MFLMEASAAVDRKLMVTKDLTPMVIGNRMALGNCTSTVLNTFL